MKLTVKQISNYLKRLGVGISDGKTVDLRTALPLNVAGRYDAARAEIAGEECIILFPRSEDISPGDIALHNAAVRNTLSARPVFAFSRLDREFAASLKAAKVAYVVPSRQVFLPPNAILESDRAYADDEKPLGAHLTPWAQVVLLDCLLHERLPGAVWFSALRKRLNITPVNLSRAARELERIMALHRDTFFADFRFPFPFVRQTDMRWRITDLATGQVIATDVPQATIWIVNRRDAKGSFMKTKSGVV